MLMILNIGLTTVNFGIKSKIRQKADFDQNGVSPKLT